MILIAQLEPSLNEMAIPFYERGQFHQQSENKQCLITSLSLKGSFFQKLKIQVIRAAQSKIYIKQFIIQGMAKGLIKIKQSEIPSQRPIQKQKVINKQSDSERSKKKCFQILEILKDFKKLQNETKTIQPSHDEMLKQAVQRVMNFFNKQKRYESDVLNLYVLCLANLFHILGNRVSNLTFESQFIKKIIDFFQGLASGQLSEISEKQKMQAGFYILAILLQEENRNESCHVCQVNRSIYFNKIIVKSILQVKLLEEKKICKYYGIVMNRIINHHQNRKIKEKIVCAIIQNLSKINYQTTFFHLLSFLRHQQTRTSLSFRTLLGANIVKTALQFYQKYVHRVQSVQILSYLNHVLIQFPGLIAATQEAQESFKVKELLSLISSQCRQQIHQSCIAICIGLFLQYSSIFKKKEIVKQIIEFIRCSKSSISLKMVRFLANNDVCDKDLIELSEKGYFNEVLDGLNLDSEGNFIQQVKFFKIIIQKITRVNLIIGQSLKYVLLRKLKFVITALPDGWHAFRNHIDQFLI